MVQNDPERAFKFLNSINFLADTLIVFITHSDTSEDELYPDLVVIIQDVTLVYDDDPLLLLGDPLRARLQSSYI